MIGTDIFGSNWRPAPLAYGWMPASGPDGPLHVLVIDSAVGRLAFAFSGEDLAAFVKAARVELSGLVTPPTNGKLR